MGQEGSREGVLWLRPDLIKVADGDALDHLDHVAVLDVSVPVCCPPCHHLRKTLVVFIEELALCMCRDGVDDANGPRR